MNRRRFLESAAACACAFPAHDAFADEPQRQEGELMPDFPIVDTHVHLWDPANLRYPWIEKSELLNRPYMPSDYEDAVKPVSVERVVFVQAACLSSQALEEVAWVSSLAQEDAWIKGIVADAPLEQGDGVASTLDTLAHNPLMRGIRRMLAGEKDPEMCLQPGFVAGTRRLAKAGFSFDMGVSRTQLPAVTELARRCPEVQFMLCHSGVPDIKNGQLDPWREHMRALAALPNVYCKLSGLATSADHQSWTREDLKPAIAHVLECFGFDRTAFGSDWPVMLLATPYARWVETVGWAVAGCSEPEKRSLFRDTAIRFYRLG